MSQILNYLKSKKLKFNVDKTKRILITTPYKYSNLHTNEKNAFIDGSKIEIVDYHLNFNAHFNYIHKKY